MQTQTVLTVPLTTQFPTHLTLEQLIQNLTSMVSSPPENPGNPSNHPLSQSPQMMRPHHHLQPQPQQPPQQPQQHQMNRLEEQLLQQQDNMPFNFTTKPISSNPMASAVTSESPPLPTRDRDSMGFKMRHKELKNSLLHRSGHPLNGHDHGSHSSPSSSPHGHAHSPSAAALSSINRWVFCLSKFSISKCQKFPF